jgi:hypothetical protein
MARYGRLLTDVHWQEIRPLLPKRPPRPRGGRPSGRNSFQLIRRRTIQANRRSRSPVKALLTDPLSTTLLQLLAALQLCVVYAFCSGGSFA